MTSYVAEGNLPAGTAGTPADRPQEAIDALIHLFSAKDNVTTLLRQEGRRGCVEFVMVRRRAVIEEHHPVSRSGCHPS